MKTTLCRVRRSQRTTARANNHKAEFTLGSSRYACLQISSRVSRRPLPPGCQQVAPGWLAASLTFYLDGADAAGPGGSSLLLLDDLAWWPPLIPGGSNTCHRDRGLRGRKIHRRSAERWKSACPPSKKPLKRNPITFHTHSWEEKNHRKCL